LSARRLITQRRAVVLRSPQNAIRRDGEPAQPSILGLTHPRVERKHEMPGDPPTLGFSLIIYATVGLVTLIALKLRRRRR
jgi:hypothetical protein